MALEDLPRGPTLSNDESAHDGPRTRPAKLLRKYLAEPHLHVQPLQQILKVADAALDFDDKQRARARVPRHEIAASTIPVMVEAHLRLHAPPSRRETPGGCLLDVGMLAIDQAVEIRSLPPNLDNERGIQRIDQPRERTDGQALQRSGFSARDRVAREPGTPPEIVLAPSATHAKPPHGGRHVRSHRWMIVDRDYPALTGRFM